MADLLRLIIAILVSLFKSRAELEAENLVCGNRSVASAADAKASACQLKIQPP
jgi:hypothetical protein